MRENDFVNYNINSLSLLESYISGCTCEICGVIHVDIARMLSNKYEKFTCECCSKSIQRDSKIDNLINGK